MKITLAVLLVCFGFLFAQDPADTITEIGQTAPSFAATTLDGSTYTLQDLKGQVVLLNFFATWCPPCLAELPELEKQIWQPNKDKNFQLLVIGREHNAEEIRTFKDKQGYDLPFAPDPKRDTYSLFAKNYIPRNVLIDQDGIIVYQSVGYDKTEFAELVEMVNELVGGV